MAGNIGSQEPQELPGRVIFVLGRRDMRDYDLAVGTDGVMDLGQTLSQAFLPSCSNKEVESVRAPCRNFRLGLVSTMM